MSLNKTMNKRNSGNSIRKRAKELDCLYAFSNLVVKNNITVDEILQGTIDLIPPASQNPEITSARIILKDQIYKTKIFKQSIWKQTSDIVVHGKPGGTLDVCYLEQLSEKDKKSFLKKEKELVNVIAERLGRIIERKKTEEALRESEKRFRDLVENSLTGIFILQGSEIVYNNPEQKRHFSRLSCSFKLMDFKAIHPDDVEMVKQNYQKIVSGEVQTLNISFRFYPLGKSDNKLDRKWVYCRISLIEYSGKEAMLFNMMDVTRSKELERLLKIKDKMTSLGRVTAGIAHEIRNPLSGINIYLNTLEKIYNKTDGPEKVNTIIGQLKLASNKIESVIKRVMDFSKPSEPRLVLSKINHPVKPIHMDELEIIISNALETIRLRKEVKALQDKYLKENLPCFIGESNAIEDVVEFIETVAKSPDTPILILGETGTGKELIAGAIHARSPNFNGPLITVNCAAIPKELIESELFGYEKGAFSGANISGKKGLIEEAEHGTLFLDEVGDLSLDAQAKLPRFLECGEFYRIGSTKKLKIKTRVVSATNKDLKKLIDNGLLRSGTK